MNKDNREKQQYTLKERFSYWFDNHVSNGIIGVVRQLAIISLIVAFIIAMLIVGLGFNGDNSLIAVLWDSFSTILNAEIPSSDAGDRGYIALMTISAIAGILFTSVLIGIITSAIEEKIIELRRGNPKVLEKGHTIILGFAPGEYTLIRQLILSADGKPGCLVIAEDMERDEILYKIKENIDIPKNFKLLCRKVVITDPASLEKCSLDTCKCIVISPIDDDMTIRTLLATSKVLHEKNVHGVRINAVISKRHKDKIPLSIEKEHNITALRTTDTLARIIAHTCTQKGLSKTFKELFNFEGCELYLVKIEEATNMTFEQVLMTMDNAVPVGVYSDHVILNPDKNYLIKPHDRLIVFAENRESARMTDKVDETDDTTLNDKAWLEEDHTDTVIIGYNGSLPTIISELPENVKHVYLSMKETDEDDKKELEEVALHRGLDIIYRDFNTKKMPELIELAKMAEHIVILNDYNKDEEYADLEVIFRLMNLRDIRQEYGLSFNITAEMRLEHNQNLIETDDQTDFIVTSSMSSLILAQLSENPELIDAFKEILSNEGNEFYIKAAQKANIYGKFSTRQLRRILYRKGYILIGIANKNSNMFNPALNEKITIDSEDRFIVLGEK